jgi:hypothetical protein
MTLCGEIDEIFGTCENYKSKYNKHYIYYAYIQTDRPTDTWRDRETVGYIEIEGCKNPR